MSGPPPGHIRLYSAIRPALLAGSYELSLDQQVDLGNGGAHALPGRTQDIELVAPRFRMAGSELFGVFPPANAEGSFTNRLAQAVLRRRTLPWERRTRPGSGDSMTPWMALVVLAAGEGAYGTDVPLAAAELAEYRGGIGLSTAEAQQAGSCNVLEVSGRTVRKAFPTSDDLPYLTHVREVNLHDSEDANKLDDDGFVAVVGSSRVLRDGQAYGAYLISVEGQVDSLPQPVDRTDEIGPPQVPPAPIVLGATFSGGSPLVDAAIGLGQGGAHPTISTIATGEADPERIRERIAGWGIDMPDEAAEWHRTMAVAAHDTSVADGADAGPLQPTDYLEGDLNLKRYPVLAHWTFRTIGDGDFESLMRNLDVGLLGTVDDAEESPPTVLATGHLLLDRHARSGERAACWFRGPLVPHELDDRDDVPLHAAEQAIRVGSDGIEDLSYAAAFELGRLLALSDPRFVSTLVSWRRRGSTRSWDRVKRRDFVLDLITPEELEHLDRHIPLGIVEQLLGGDGVFGPLGPLVNPVPLRELYDPAADIASLTKIGLEQSLIEDALGVATTPSGFGTTVLDLGTFADSATFENILLGVDGGLTTGLAQSLTAAWKRDADRIADMGGGE